MVRIGVVLTEEKVAQAHRDMGISAPEGRKLANITQYIADILQDELTAHVCTLRVTEILESIVDAGDHEMAMADDEGLEQRARDLAEALHLRGTRIITYYDSKLGFRPGFDVHAWGNPIFKQPVDMTVVAEACRLLLIMQISGPTWVPTAIAKEEYDKKLRRNIQDLEAKSKEKDGDN